MSAYYVVRYRSGYGNNITALIVEDERGTAYLYSNGRLQGRLEGRNAPARLARIMARRSRWTPVPEVEPYTLEGLRRLTGETLGYDLSGLHRASGAGEAANHR